MQSWSANFQKNCSPIQSWSGRNWLQSWSSPDPCSSLVVHWCGTQASSHNSQGVVNGGVDEAGMSTAAPNKCAVLCVWVHQGEGGYSQSCCSSTSAGDSNSPQECNAWCHLLAKWLKVMAVRERPVQRYSKVFGFGAEGQGFPVAFDITLTFNFLAVEVEGCWHHLCSAKCLFFSSCLSTKSRSVFPNRSWNFWEIFSLISVLKNFSRMDRWWREELQLLVTIKRRFSSYEWNKLFERHTQLRLLPNQIFYQSHFMF